ncbi:hypothetical protein NECID01_1228 [Nematocida sp. AWRm77]|nr:hypothetical protein NECID01_1228 [Nematocida sp. AWRm77]
MQIVWRPFIWVFVLLCAIASSKPLNIAVLSTYPPTNCGIAEFTKNMCTSIVEAAPEDVRIHVFSTSKIPHKSSPPTIPGVTVTQIYYTFKNEKATLRELAKTINQSQFDVLLVQHEDGLMHEPMDFVYFLQRVSSQIRTYVFIHTGLPYPDMRRRNMYKRLEAYSDGLVALGWKVKEALHHAYGVHKNKILYFPHGVTIDTSAKLLRKADKKKNKFVVQMSGIMKREKGIIEVLKALEILRKRNQLKNIMLHVIGRDNSNGAHYREISKIVKKKNLEKHFNWIYKFASVKELTKKHCSADLYLAPFQGEVPTSGTLTFAMSCGLPVVATPFGMSGELLGMQARIPEGSSGKIRQGQKEKTTYTKYGAIIPYQSVEAIANAIHTMKKQTKKRRAMGKNAEEKMEQITWTKVGSALYTYLTEKIMPASLLPNPYKKTLYNSVCCWTNKKVQGFDGKAIATPSDGAYILYTDPFVSINVQIQKGAIVSLAARVYKEEAARRGVLCNEAFVYASKMKPLKVLPGSKATKKVCKYIQIVDTNNILESKKMPNRLHISTPNIVFSISLGSGNSVHFKVHKDNRFGYARGILGSTLMKKYSHMHNDVFPLGMWKLGAWSTSAFEDNPASISESRYRGSFYGSPFSLLLGKKTAPKAQKKYILSKMLSPGPQQGAARKEFLTEWSNPENRIYVKIAQKYPAKVVCSLSLEQYIVLEYVFRQRRQML